MSQTKVYAKTKLKKTLLELMKKALYKTLIS